MKQQIIQPLRAEKKQKREPLSRTWFLGHGYKQVPPEIIDGKILWAHPSGHFCNAFGQKIAPNSGPAMQDTKKNHGHKFAIMRNHGHKYVWELILSAFRCIRPKPLWDIDGKLKPYECHHLNGNSLDNCLDNIVWLWRPIHRVYDRRMRAIREVVGDLSKIPYDTLLQLESPTRTNDLKFNRWLDITRQLFTRRSPEQQIQLETSTHLYDELTIDS